MAYKNLNDFISVLEKNNELVRISANVSPYLEMTEIADRLVKSNRKAVLFENTGTEFPVLMNAFASDKRLKLAFRDRNPDAIAAEMQSLLQKIRIIPTGFVGKISMLPYLQSMASWFPFVSGRKGECQECVMTEPDLTRLPVLTCWPHDAGPFFTLPVVHTKDPETGIPNAGMYRMQVFSKNTTGMHWHLHKGSATHFRKYKTLKKKMPVAVTLGGDPVYTWCASAPLPENIDEYLLAGFIRNKKVKKVKCLTVDIDVPADVDFVLEGYIDPEEDLALEGPFGDHTGFYSLPDYYPVFHVTCITHRKNAVFPATVVGIPPMEDYWLGKATERIFKFPIQLTLVPELVDIHMPAEGVFHNLVIISVNNYYPGLPAKALHALWGAGQMSLNKICVVVDGDVVTHDYQAVLKAVMDNVSIPDDLIWSQGPLDVLDHASRKFALGGKLGIDATRKADFSKKSDNLVIPDSIDFPQEVVDFNFQLLKLGYPICAISVRKSMISDIKTWVKKHIELFALFRFVFILDEVVNIQDFKSLSWNVLNHIDPQYDCFVMNHCLYMDASFKVGALDFTRPWPEIVVMNQETIKKIDEKWPELNLGELILSPSLAYLRQQKGNRAEISIA